MNRREFLKTAAVGTAGLYLLRESEGTAWAFSQSPPLRKFIQPLPGLGASGIPLAAPNTTAYPGHDFYRIVMGQYTYPLHPDLPNATKLWGYADATADDHWDNPNYQASDLVFRPLGPLIVAQSGRPVRVRYIDNLPATHILPVDNSLMGAEADQPQNRAVVHLHGGHVPWTSDGGPFAWSTPGNVVNGPHWQPGDYFYPNDQSARLMWYHDHALGITRLNAYANLASGYLLTDSVEAALIGSGAIPSRQIPLIIQDKSFKQLPDRWGQPGDLWYPSVYEGPPLPDDFRSQDPASTGRWDRGGAGILPLPNPSCVPEFFADTMLVNGLVYPYVSVEPRRYRFRILNACNARFLNLQLYYADASGSEADLSKPGPTFLQIGTEGGFLPEPVVLNAPPVQIGFDPETENANRYNLLLAPAERADLIIDFSAVPVGAQLILYSDAPAPFPGGDPRNDYYTGAPDLSRFGGVPSPRPGFGPNTRTLLQFRVAPLVGLPDPTPGALILPPVPPLDPSGLRPQGKTLNEDFDAYGRLIQRLGTTEPTGSDNEGNPTWGRDFMSEPTEAASGGETQVWDVYNLTGDTHPIHFHLVNVQILGRAPFDEHQPTSALGPFRPPDANERGWKETVRMNPGEVTRVIMKFDALTPPAWVTTKTSPRFTGKYEYVWHCHILEHEEHDMMRSLVVG